MTTENNNKVLVKHWYLVFFTYSFWLHLSSVVLALVEGVLPFFHLLEPTMSTQAFSICMFTLNALGVLAKFIRQRKNEERRQEIENDANNKLD